MNNDDFLKNITFKYNYEKNKKITGHIYNIAAKSGCAMPFCEDEAELSLCAFYNNSLAGFISVLRNELTGVWDASPEFCKIPELLIKNIAFEYHKRYGTDAPLFCADGNIYNAALNAGFNTSYFYSEYILTLTYDDYKNNPLTSVIPDGFDDAQLYFTDDKSDYLLYKNDYDDEPCAVCSLNYEKNQTCIFDVYVDENLRGKNVGTFLVYSLLKDYFKYYKSPLVLQVSGLNTAAVKLYKKAGFYITEQLDYYRLYI